MSDFGEQYQIGGVDDEQDAGDDGADEAEPDTEAQEPEASQPVGEDPVADPEPASSTSEHDSSTDSQSDAAGPYDDIPHRLKYDSPKTGRSEKTIVVEDRDDDRFDELESLAKREFDQKVFKMDVYIAAIRAGLDNPDEAFLAEMGKIGYGVVD